VIAGIASESLGPAAAGAAGGDPLRILAVGNMYPPQHAGGYELAWQHAVRHARSLGHRVRVLTSDYREDARRSEEDPDVHRTLRWYWDLERYEFRCPSLLGRVRLERQNAAELRRHLDGFRPDIVTWWSMGCMSLSLIEQVRRRGIPAVFVVHDDWLVYGWDHDRWMRTWIGPRRRRLVPIVESLFRVPAEVDINHAGPFVFNSRYTLERAQTIRLDGPVTTVVYPGIDERFREALPAEPWRWRLAYVGRIDRQKGIDTAVAALAHLPRTATLSIWGRGDKAYIAEMKALADRLGVGDRVRFCGFSGAERLRLAYREADVVVFPVRWNEPFGLVPLEAMGVGRPVVTTARGGMAEFVRDGDNALVVPADDATALAGSVERLAADPRLRSRLTEAGFRTASQHSAARFARRTVEAIVQAATPSRASGANRR
jgi:glycosyltransferase involved in cell wall biosynthesis